MVCITQNNTDSALRRVKKRDNSRRTASKSKTLRKLQVECEFLALRSLLPDVANKSGISSLDVVLSAIDYIQRLEKQLGCVDPEVLRNNFLRSRWAALAMDNTSSS
jgi:hypothetical protein